MSLRWPQTQIQTTCLSLAFGPRPLRATLEWDHVIEGQTQIFVFGGSRKIRIFFLKYDGEACFLFNLNNYFQDWFFVL